MLTVFFSWLTISMTEPIWTWYLYAIHVICSWKRILFWSMPYGGASCEHPCFGSSYASTLWTKTDQFIEWVSDHVQYRLKRSFPFFFSYGLQGWGSSLLYDSAILNSSYYHILLCKTSTAYYNCIITSCRVRWSSSLSVLSSTVNSR